MPAGRYEGYVNSRAWASNRGRLEELRLSGRRCRLCNCRHCLEVHHRSYARLGHERATDLTTLCHECHKMVTAFLRYRRYRKRRLPAVTSVAPPMARHLLDSTEGWPHVC